MKKFIPYIYMVILALGVFSSCEREVSILKNDCGYLSVGLDHDLSEDMVTRADGTDAPVFAIDVLNLSGELVAGCDDHRTTVENPIELHVGKYTVVARNGEKANAAFDAPYYEGRTESPVTVRPERTVEASLTCSMANTAFSVEFADAFASFAEYEVTVTNGVGEALVLSSNPDGNNPLEAGLSSKAYFDVTGTLEWEVYLRNADGGEYIQSGTISDVKAKHHYHLSFYLGEDTTNDGALILKVNLQNTWVDNNHDMNLEFNRKDVPQFTVTEEFPVVSGQPYSIPKGDATEKIISFSAVEGIKTLKITHNSDKLAAAGVPRSNILDGAQEASVQTRASADVLAALSAAGIVVDEDLSKVNLTSLFSKISSGTYTIEFAVTDNKDVTEFFILVVEVVSEGAAAEAAGVKTGWAAFARLEAKLFDDSKAADVIFQYRKASEAEWTSVPAHAVATDLSSMTMTAVVNGLASSTDYVFRVITDGSDDAKTVEFRTEASPVLHNLSFDNWTDSNKFPNASGFKIWDSANSSGASTTTTPVTDAIRGKAAKLESIMAMSVMFAAGNIFTGEFRGLDGLSAKLGWGVPFEGRPLALRGYYKYSPATINKVKDPYKDLKGQMDQCQILICLTDWDAPFEVNTKNNSFVDFDNDEKIIAFAQFNTSESSSEYIEFTLPLVYRNNRIPKYIVIAGASSRYGDYFTGGVGSTLYLDEFELVYDPAELTDEQYDHVFSKVQPF